jgi:hypothetical protein
MEEIFLLHSLSAIELNRKRWKSRNFTLMLHLHSMVMHAIFVSCAIFLFIKHNQPWFQFFFLLPFGFINFLFFSMPIKKSLTFVRTRAIYIFPVNQSASALWSFLLFPSSSSSSFSCFLFFLWLLIFIVYLHGFVCSYIDDYKISSFYSNIHPSIPWATMNMCVYA